MEIHCAECGEVMKITEHYGKTYAACEECDKEHDKLFKNYKKVNQLYTDLQDHLKALLQ